MANVSLPAGSPAPDSVRVALVVNGISRGTFPFTGASLQAGGAAQRLAVSFSDDGLATGVHAVELTVTTVYVGGATHSTTTNGDLVVVNRTVSPYGAGWSVLGVPRLFAGQRASALLHVDGDGSAATYEVIAANTWRAPVSSFRDTIRYEYISDPGFDASGAWQPGHYYWSRDLDGTRTFYDGASGRAVWVHSRSGDLAQYLYGPQGELTAIRVAPYAAALMYTLAYSGGYLDSVQDPAGRVLDVTVSGGQLTELLDPGLAAHEKVVFGYTNNLMASRRSARGHYTSFTYQPGTSVLTHATLPPTHAGSGTITFTPVQVRGLWQGSGTALLPAGDATVQINGPRTDVGDVTTFGVNGQNAPGWVIGPTNEAMTLDPTNPALPDRPTHVTIRNGRMIVYDWNENGTIAQVRDITDHLANGLPTAVTRYTYGSPHTKARPDTIIDPMGLRTVFTYRSDGQISTVTAPNGHVTQFRYKTSGSNGFPGQLEAVIEQNVTTFDNTQLAEVLLSPKTSFTYDAWGNLQTQTSPRGGVTTFQRDGAGRVEHVYDPAGHHNQYVYDALNRVRNYIHHDSTGATHVTAQNYGAETLDAVIDPRGVTRQFGYDALGRMISETDEAGVAEAGGTTRASQSDCVDSTPRTRSTRRHFKRQKTPVASRTPTPSARSDHKYKTRCRE